MGHPYKQFRGNKVASARAGELLKGYTGSVPEATPSKKLARVGISKSGMDMDDEPIARRASGGRVGKKAGPVTVNVITQSAPQQPPAPPMPPPAAMAPPPPPPPPGPPPGGPPPGAMAGGPGGMPPMMGRKHGGAVKSKGMKVGTKVQHDNAHMEVGKLNRPRVVTFKTGGGVVSFKAGGGAVKAPDGKEPQPGDLYSPEQVKRLETQRATGGRIYAPEKGGMGPRLPGGAGGGEGRLKKTRMTHKGVQV